MGSTPEEFAELRRLLALKRRELPPPGYYHTFAGKVIARIEAEGLSQSRSWWVRLFAVGEWSPAFAETNTALVAGLACLGGVAFVLKNRFDRVGQPSNSEVAIQSGAPSMAPRQLVPGLPGDRTAGAGSETFLSGLGGSLVSFPGAASVTQFRMERPTVRERVRHEENFQVPAGIFEPWNRPSTAFPTSIINSVEFPR